MHREAMDWVSRFRTDEPITVLDIGGRNINGTVRDLFPNAHFTAIDIAEGEGVSIVCDAGTWQPTGQWDVVTCTEVFEHAANWRDIVATAFAALCSGGLFVATCAGPGRAIHSGVDGYSQLHVGETYDNVAPEDLQAQLEAVGFEQIVVDYKPNPADTRCSAVRP